MLGLQAVKWCPRVAFESTPESFLVPLFHTVHLNHMLTAGTTLQLGWTYSVWVWVRNSVSMETDQGDKGDACLLHSSLSMLTDHNMKTQAIALLSLPPSISIPRFLFEYISPFLLVSAWPFLLISPSNTLLFWLCPYFSVILFVRDREDRKNGLWRNVCREIN